MCNLSGIKKAKDKCMFIRENIIFENDATINGSMISKDEIIDAVYEVSLKLIDEMKITSLKKIIIKRMDFFEKTLGTARTNGKSATIELAYVIAVNIKNDPKRNNKEKHKEAMATLYHEFCHVRDFELIWKRIIKEDGNISKELEIGFDVWTEFFATYSSFTIYEDIRLYDAFKDSFQRNTSDKEYYTSKVLGYYLNKEHSIYCNELVEMYLNKGEVDKIVSCFERMISAYSEISESDLKECGRLIQKTYERGVLHDKLIPMNAYNLFFGKNNKFNI